MSSLPERLRLEENLMRKTRLLRLLAWAVVITSLPLFLVKYDLRGQEPNAFRTLLTLDPETNELLKKIELYDISDFAVDANGTIYILDRKNKEHSIFAFDRDGRFISSFGRKGQGPGQNQNISRMFVTGHHELFVRDMGNQKIMYFNSKGEMLRELRTPSDIEGILPLSNGNYVGTKSQIDPASKEIVIGLNLYDAEFREKRLIDRISYPNTFLSERITAEYNILTYMSTDDFIYYGFPRSGYAIIKTSLNGDRLSRIIGPVRESPLNDLYKAEFQKKIGSIYEAIKEKIEFPKYLPPFHSFTVSDKGELYVMTYEYAGRTEVYGYDIYDSSGVLRGKMGIGAFYDTNGIYMKIIQDRLICLNEKESGYKEINVLAMK
jgi:6-bladed beta-propeller